MTWIRAGTALLIAVVTSSTIVAAAGLDRNADEPLKAVAHIAALTGGTSGIYSRGADTIEFRVERQFWLDAHGVETEGLVLTQTRSDLRMDAQARTWRFWLDQGDIVASMRAIDDGGGGAYIGVGGDMTALHGEFTRYAMAYAPWLIPLCGMVTPLQGRAVDDQSRLTGPGCAAFADAEPSFGPHGAVTFEAGGRAVVFGPVASVPERIVDGGTWVLTSYAAGNESGEARRGERWPVSTTRAAIPDETGVEHLFPLSAALDYAMTGPQPNAFGSALSRAGFYLAHASFEERVEEGTRRLTWTLTASNGWNEQTVEVSKSAAQADDNQAQQPIVPAGTLPASPQPLVREVASPQRDFPVMPLAMPRLADLAPLQERWEATSPQSTPIRAWGFDIVCGKTCDEAVATTWFGRNTQRGMNEAFRDASCYIACDGVRLIAKQDVLTVDEDGRTVVHMRTSWRIRDQAYYVLGTAAVEDHGRSNDRGPDSSLQLASSAWSWQRPDLTVATGVGVLGVLAGAIYYFAPALKLAFFGRSRPIEDEHPIRRGIAALLARTPGSHLHAIERALKHPTGTIRHHLRHMESAGTIVVRRSGGYNCYFLARGTDHRVAGAAGALKAPAARQILERTLQGPIPMGMAASIAGITAGAATHHAVRLEQAGLVERHRVGRHVELRATSLAAQAIQALA